MKKILFIAATLLLMSAQMVQAQTKISFDGYGALEFKFKRCYVQGPWCIVDVLMTNNTKMDLTPCAMVEAQPSHLNAYDDEGNVYDRWAVKGTIGNLSFGGGDRGSNCISMPAGTSLKLQFKIKDFDEFATKITALTLHMRGVSDEAYGEAYLKMKDIPVTRPD